MKYIIRHLLSILFSTSVLLNLTACQLLIPKAQGLQTTSWQAQSYARQDLVEVQWKEHGFSFLLYQQQQGSQLEMVALSLTGQPLFQLVFDGQQVKVQQRIDQMKLLPFDFVVRDILFATYPEFVKMQGENVQIQQQILSKNLPEQQNDQADHGIATQTILIQQQKVLSIRHLQDHIELDNVQVPYQMVFSEVPDTLENNE